MKLHPRDLRDEVERALNIDGCSLSPDQVELRPGKDGAYVVRAIGRMGKQPVGTRRLVKDGAGLRVDRRHAKGNAEFDPVGS